MTPLPGLERPADRCRRTSFAVRENSPMPLSKRRLCRFTENEAARPAAALPLAFQESFSMKPRLTAAVMTVLLTTLGSGIALAESPLEKSVRQDGRDVRKDATHDAKEVDKGAAHAADEADRTDNHLDKERHREDKKLDKEYKKTL